MRKAIAVVSVFLQLAFGVFLIAEGGKADRAREARIDEILQNGTEFLFDLSSIEYNSEDRYAETVAFNLYADEMDYAYDFYPLAANDFGAAVFGPSTETPPAEPYFSMWNGETYYRIDAETLKTLFGADAEDGYCYYTRNWLQPKKNRFFINGEWVSVYAVGTVYQGDLVYTGLVVAGVRY